MGPGSCKKKVVQSEEQKNSFYKHSRAPIIQTSKVHTVDNPDLSQADTSKIRLIRWKMLDANVTIRILQRISVSSKIAIDFCRRRLRQRNRSRFRRYRSVNTFARKHGSQVIRRKFLTQSSFTTFFSALRHLLGGSTKITIDFSRLRSCWRNRLLFRRYWSVI